MSTPKPRTVSPWMVVLAVAGLAAFAMGVYALVHESPSSEVGGSVTVRQPNGEGIRVCVEDRGGQGELCGTTYPSDASTYATATDLVVGDCARLKVTRGAVLSLGTLPCQ